MLIPTYSSRWKNVIRFHGIGRARTNSASISNWDAPVARITLAAPRATNAWWIHSTPSLAASAPNSCLSRAIMTFMKGTLPEGSAERKQKSESYAKAYQHVQQTPCEVGAVRRAAVQFGN